MRWLCECERTNAEGQTQCWSCLRERRETGAETIARLTAEVERLTAREQHFARVLGVCDGGQYRADWDSRITALVEQVATLTAEVEAMRAERDEAQGLLVEALPWLDGFDNAGDLRARIAAHLGRTE